MRQVIEMAALMAGLALTVSAVNPSAAYIQRTFKTLEASTAENPATVRVLFYGQSITAQAWTQTVQETLKERYPTVAFEFKNAAIGGYQSPLLIRTAEHDLYPWYPDLLFFHVYGPTEPYEEIIKRVRARTSAEIVLWTSHLNADEKPGDFSDKLDARSLKILDVADTYHCMKINLREKWCAYLQANNLASTNLLNDFIHLNTAGCALYAQCIEEELVRVPALGDDPTAAGTLTEVALRAPEVETGADGRLTLRFTGNRVVAVSDGTGAAGARAKVLLDGKSMEGNPDLWAQTLPSKGPAGIWMPAINRIGFESVPTTESWTLTCLPDSAPGGKEIHFRLHGTVTGEDGEGWSTQRFVSRSRRTVIESDDWHIAWELGYKKAVLPESFRVTWQTYPLFTDTYASQPVRTRTLLMQGCAVGSHTLTLIPQGGPLGIGGFVVYAPAR